MRFSVARSFVAATFFLVSWTGVVSAQGVCQSTSVQLGAELSAVGEGRMMASPGARCAIAMTGGTYDGMRVHTPARQGTVEITPRGFTYIAAPNASGQDFFQVSWYSGSEQRIIAFRVTFVGGGANPFAPGSPGTVRK